MLLNLVFSDTSNTGLTILASVASFIFWSATWSLFGLVSRAVRNSPMPGKVLLNGAVDCSDMLCEVVFAVELLGTVRAFMSKTWSILVCPLMSSTRTMRKECHSTHNAWIRLLGWSARCGSLPACARLWTWSSALNDGPNTGWPWYSVYGIQRSRGARL